MMEREPDWKNMYMTLLRKVNEALELLPLFPENIKIYKILEEGMQNAEEIYIKGGDPNLAEETEENS